MDVLKESCSSIRIWKDIEDRLCKVLILQIPKCPWTERSGQFTNKSQGWG